MVVTRWCSLVLAGVLIAASAPAATAGGIGDRVQRHVEAAVADGIKPVDFHHLLFATAWRETFADWSVAERALDRLSGPRRIDPLMADELRLLRARLEAERGRDAAARELFRTMGGLGSWWFDGPYPLEELSDFDRAAAPPPPAPSWREVPGTDALGWVGLSGLAWPSQRQFAYLATTIVSDRDQPVAVRVGAAQVARLWLNGTEVLTTGQPLEMAEDQVAGGGWLRAGRNVLVVAVASENDQWWLRARLSQPDGQPLGGVREVGESPQPVAALDRPAPAVRDLGTELRREVEAGTPSARLALAAWLVAHRPEPAGGGDTRAACRAARQEDPAEARLLEWLVTSDPATSRDLLAEAVTADRNLVWARLELADWYGERGLYEQARGLLLEGDPDEPSVQSTLLSLDSMLWGQLVMPALAEVAEGSPRCVEANLRLAAASSRSRRWDLAAEALERLAAVTPGLASVIQMREDFAETCGDGATLRDLYTSRLDRDPNRVGARVRLARLLAADGDVEGARELLQGGLQRSPTNVDLLMELAATEHAAGDDQRARSAAREVLEIRPQNRRAQRLLELLGETVEDRQWIRGPEALWRLADEAPPASPAVVVLDHREIEFLPSNLSEERVQRALLIADADRAGDLLVQRVPFVSESDRLRVLSARILRRDGSEISARQGDTPRLSEPEFNIFYDTRLRFIRFPEFEDGDLVEITYVKTETEESNQTGPYNGGLLVLGGGLPVANLEVELIAPQGGMPAWELVHLEGDPVDEVAEDGTRRLRWQWRDLAAVPSDLPPAPPLLITPHLLYSNLHEWGDLADWYGRHVEPRIRVSQQVEDTARRLVDGADDRLDRIARLYRFVSNEIRYVGLEFGEHRFRPFSADWVLHHGIGDCKDKSALLVALLDVLGIPARMVMVRTADLGPVASGMAVLELFNHAIVYLPEDDLWLDGTASGHAVYPPPTQDQGAFVLVVDGRSSGPRTTPVVGGGLQQLHYELARGDDGRVRISIRAEDTGEAADRRRVRFAGSRESQRFARWLQGQFPGAELVGEPRLQLVPSRDPTVIEIEGVAAASVLASAGGITLFPGNPEWSAGLVPSGDRVGPLMVATRPDLAWTLEVELGRPPTTLPEDVALETAFGALRVEVEAEATGYRVEGMLHLVPGLVESVDVARLREFLVEAERVLERRVEAP